MELPSAKLAFSISEWCEATAQSRSATYADIASGLLPAKKRGRRTIILREDGQRYLESLPDFSAAA